MQKHGFISLTSYHELKEGSLKETTETNIQNDSFYMMFGKRQNYRDVINACKSETILKLKVYGLKKRQLIEEEKIVWGRDNSSFLDMYI